MIRKDHMICYAHGNIMQIEPLACKMSAFWNMNLMILQINFKNKTKLHLLLI